MNGLMADFDFVAEFSNPMLFNILQSQVQIAGQPLNPPIEVEIPISGGGISGDAHMIVDDVTLDLNAGDTIALNFVFGSASVNSISGLDGNFTVIAPVMLVGSGSSRSIGVNFANANVNINFTPASMDRINNSFPLGADVFKDFTRRALESYFRGLDLQTLPFQFNVDATQNGQLSPLRFVRLEVHCISHQQRDRQALGLFGILLLSNTSRGDSSAKTQTAIPSGQDVCMNLSPDAFHTLAFCAGILNTPTFSGVSVSQLPPSCGSASGIDRQGVTITRLADSFSNGHIDIDASLEKSGFCYTATGSAHGQLTFTMTGTTLTPVFNPDPPTTDFDIPWYCVVAAVITAGGIALVIAAIVDEIGENLVQNIASAAVGALAVGGFNISGVAGIAFQTVSITSEGLTLCGTVPRIPLPRSERRGISLSGSVVTANKSAISTGTFDDDPCPAPASSPIPAGPYPYTEWAQDQVGTYEAVGPTLLGRPLTYEWWITSGSDRADLTGSGTTASITVEAHFPFPLPGGSSVTHQARVGYTINTNRIELTNDPTDGRYSLGLHVRATDPSGRSALAYASVVFIGHWVEISGSYSGAAARCMREILRIIEDERIATIKEPRELPPLPPPDHPPLEHLLDFAYNVITTSERPERMERLLNDATLAYDGTLQSALESQDVLERWLTDRRT